MKNIFYKKPIISSVIINTTSTALALNSLNNDQFLLLSPLVLTYFFNKRLLLKGENLNKINKVILAFIYFISIILIFLLNKYIGLIKI